jgi:hypothetical protein
VRAGGAAVGGGVGVVRAGGAAVGGVGRAGGSAAGGGVGRGGGAAAGGDGGGVGRGGGAAAGGGGGGVGRGGGAAAGGGGGVGRGGGAAAGGGGGVGRGGGAAAGGAPFGGSPLGGCFGFPSGPSSSLAWATTSGAVCACDAELASCITVNAVVASSTRRRFVIMLGSRRSSWQERNRWSRRSRRIDQRLIIRPHCGESQNGNAI